MVAIQGIREWPGLLECARRNSSILALYAPQLTIPGFDDGFSEEFDRLTSPEMGSSCDAARYGGAETVDGNPPLCGDFVAWRHPTYGNYTPAELSYEFVSAHNAHYSRQVFNGFECLVWLLCDESRWMPDDLRETLKLGFRDRVFWWVPQISDSTDAVLDTLHSKPRSRFSYTRALRSELTASCARAMHRLAIAENTDNVVSHFIETGFLEGYYEEQERVRERRKR